MNRMTAYNWRTPRNPLKRRRRRREREEMATDEGAKQRLAFGKGAGGGLVLRGTELRGEEPELRGPRERSSGPG